MFNFDRFLFALQYMWKGMLCIFVVIAVIIGSIYLMNVIHNAVAKKKALRQGEQNNQ
ncbi:MAG: hypothetical protein E7624_05920 [Ruminococcaceae bacterium]|nr:hypothetical protein [Oscillospiraceae bacterium]